MTADLTTRVQGPLINFLPQNMRVKKITQYWIQKVIHLQTVIINQVK
jgi:hypothetical protein